MMPRDMVYTRRGYLKIIILLEDRQQNITTHITQNMRYDDHETKTTVGMQWHIIYANNLMVFVILRTLCDSCRGVYMKVKH